MHEPFASPELAVNTTVEEAGRGGSIVEDNEPAVVLNGPGPVSLGLKPYTSRLVFPLAWEDMTVWYKDWWSGSYAVKTLDPVQFRAEIPLSLAGGWIRNLSCELKSYYRPPKVWQARVDFGTNIPSLPLNSSLLDGNGNLYGQGTVPGIDIRSFYSTYSEGAIPLSGLLALDTPKIWLHLKHLVGDAITLWGDPKYYVYYFEIALNYALPLYDDMGHFTTPNVFLPSLSANLTTLNARRAMAATTELNLAGTAYPKYNAVLAADLPLSGSGYGEISGLGFIDSWPKFAGSLSGSANLQARKALFVPSYEPFYPGRKGGNAPKQKLTSSAELSSEVAMSATATPLTRGIESAVLNRITNMTNSFTAQQCLFTGNLQGTFQLGATLPATWGAAVSQVSGQYAISGGLIPALSGSPSVELITDIGGASSFDIDATSWVEISRPIYGNVSFVLGDEAAVTYSRPQPALGENTFGIGPRERQIDVGPRPKTVAVGARDRTVQVGKRDRTIFVQSQQGS